MELDLEAALKNIVHHKKVNLFGDPDVGKKSLISLMKNYLDKDFVLNDQNKNNNNANDNNSKKIVEKIHKLYLKLKTGKNQEILNLNIYETKIDENLDSIKEHLETILFDSECIIILFSITSSNSFNTACDLLNLIIDYKTKGNEYIPPIFLIGNKKDLNFNREVSIQETKDFLINNFQKESEENNAIYLIENKDKECQCHIRYMEISLKEKEKTNFIEFLNLLSTILKKEELKYISENTEYVEEYLRKKEDKKTNDLNTSNQSKIEIENKKPIKKYFYPVKIIDPPDTKIKDLKKHTYINLNLFGSSTVGKTCFINSFLKSTFFQNLTATVGVDSFDTFAMIDNELINVRFWDTSGQDRLRGALPKQLFKSTDGMLILFDVTNKKTFDEVQSWIEDIRTNKGASIENIKQKTEDEILYLIGNKIDLQDQRVISSDEGKKLAEKYNLRYFETSCKDAINTYEMICKLVYDCLPYRMKYKEKLKIKKQEQNKRHCC